MKSSNLKLLPTLLILFPITPLLAQAPTCSLNHLPKLVTSSIRNMDPGWKILSQDLLIPDDQKIWAQGHGAACPGVAIGNFTGSGKGYAVSLVKPSDGKYTYQVLVFTPHRQLFKRIQLVPPMKVDVLDVLSEDPPGRFTNAEKIILW